MSIEIKTQVPAPVAAQDGAPLAAGRRGGVRPWQRRRYQVGVFALIVAVVAAVIGNSYLTRQYSPDGAVRAYLSALQAGDANLAWTQMQVAAPSGAVTASATDQRALAAALSLAKPDIRSFSIASTTQANSTTASVVVSYDTSTGSKQASYLVERSGATQFGIYPSWRVVITPALLQLNLPAGSSGLTIDGRQISAGAGKATIAVLPLPHKIVINGTALFTEQTLNIDSSQSSGGNIGYSPRLTDAGLGKAKGAVQAAFAACAAQTLSYQAQGSGCPQSANGAAGTGQWRVIGDPAADLQIGFGQDLSLVASGHYQMVFSHLTESGTEHDLDAAAYTASMTATASDLTAGNIQKATSGAAPLQRPAAATDDATKAVVAKALAACAGVHVVYQADCPQQLIDLLVTDVSWSQTGDPTAGATVNFDSNTGVFMVTGPLDMRATYLSAGFSKSGVGLSTTYQAYLVWDGQALQLVTIKGAS